MNYAHMRRFLESRLKLAKKKQSQTILTDEWDVGYACAETDLLEELLMFIDDDADDSR